MDQSNLSQVPPMELPKPQGEIPPAPADQFQATPTTEAGVAQAIEQGIAMPGLPMPAPIDPTAAQQLQPVNPIAALAQPTTQPALAYPEIAEDNDLIEKEWVVKAKEIVNKTRNDPHLQNEEMNKVKADYLKKRYNKDISLGKE